MTWKGLLAERRIAKEPTDRSEIRSLRAVVERNISDANFKGISADGRYGHAYDAARVIAAILIRASGYRVKLEGGGHYNTFQALQAVDQEFVAMANYLDACRRKRNDFLYEAANVVSGTEAEELILRATNLILSVDSWLKKHHPDLI